MKSRILLKLIITFMVVVYTISNSYSQNITYQGYGSGISGSYSSYFGYYAGSSNHSYYNTFIGSYSGQEHYSGDKNTFIGSYSGRGYSLGSQNIFVGYKAGYGYDYMGYADGNGNNNIYIGNESGYNNMSGSNNLIMGYQAGYGISSPNAAGSGNVFLGYRSGYRNSNGNNNVFIGYQAGYNETGSNKLYIDNSNTTTPLIWGDFSNDFVNINGEFGVGGETVIDQNGAYFYSNGYSNTSKFGASLDGFGIDAQNSGDIDLLVLENKTYTSNLELGYLGTAILSTNSTNQDLIINPNGSGNTVVVGKTETDNLQINNLNPSTSTKVLVADASGNVYYNNVVTDTERTNWNTAFGWGNHADAGYLTSFTEADPEFNASDAKSITAIDIANWNNAFSIWQKDPINGTYYNGNVAIGTSFTGFPTGNYNLFVEGGIISNEVRVLTKALWYDFVFAPDYQLRPLSEVEQFIKQNRHLPDIPTAEEVAKEGIDVGEMNAKLLLKIEELTLYTIELEKQVKTLQQQNNDIEQLQSENEAIKAQLQQILDKLK